MFLSNLHAHTRYSDGDSSAEDYVKNAIEKGFVSVGISDHSPLVLDFGRLNWVRDLHLKQDAYNAYIQELAELRETYREEIEIYIGIEEDYYPLAKREGIDYTIGAVHFLKSPMGGDYFMVDYSVEEFEKAAEAFGSIENFITAYYERLRWVVKEQKPEILSHIDLPTKFHEREPMFNTNEGWYRTMVKEVLDEAAKTNIIIELNSGAISRGYRTTPYPEDFIMQEMRKRDIPMTISADAHHADSIATAFPEMVAYAKDHGYKTAKMLTQGAFQDVSL